MMQTTDQQVEDIWTKLQQQRQVSAGCWRFENVNSYWRLMIVRALNTQTTCLPDLK